MRLARGERQDMVKMLSDEGMSTRAIAPIVGASFKTVARDTEAPVSNDTPEPTPTAVDTETGEIHDEPVAGPAAQSRKYRVNHHAKVGCDTRSGKRKH